MEAVDERRELVSKIVPRGERIVVTVEQEGGDRGRSIVKVWREKKNAITLADSEVNRR